ncbi:MAG TPA: hypothetical protein VGM69_18950 [Chloroflexota bacterium]
MDDRRGVADRGNRLTIRLLPGWAEALAVIRPNVVGERRRTVAGTEVRYLLFRRTPGGPGAWWDADGSVYIPDQDEFIGSDERRAGLIALHEQTEYRHRAAGRPHAYAHRRAYLAELLAAREVLDPLELERYVRERLRPYPSWKVPDPDALADSLLHVLNAAKPRRGELFRRIAEPRI